MKEWTADQRLDNLPTGTKFKCHGVEYSVMSVEDGDTAYTWVRRMDDYRVSHWNNDTMVEALVDMPRLVKDISAGETFKRKGVKFLKLLSMDRPLLTSAANLATGLVMGFNDDDREDVV